MKGYKSLLAFPVSPNSLKMSFFGSHAPQSCDGQRHVNS